MNANGNRSCVTVSRLLSRNSPFSSAIRKLYVDRFVTGTDVETMISRNISTGADAVRVKELCFLFVLHVMQPSADSISRSLDRYTAICLSRLGRASREAGLPKALRDFCEVRCRDLHKLASFC